MHPHPFSLVGSRQLVLLFPLILWCFSHLLHFGCAIPNEDFVNLANTTNCMSNATCIRTKLLEDGYCFLPSDCNSTFCYKTSCQEVLGTCINKTDIPCDPSQAVCTCDNFDYTSECDAVNDGKTVQAKTNCSTLFSNENYFIGERGGVCPPNSQVNFMTGNEENVWTSKRLQNIASKLASRFGTIKKVPKIGIAVSGGGYRATTVGLGNFLGMTQISQNGVNFFDFSLYQVGLSGGAWFVVGSTVYDSDFPVYRNQLSQNLTTFVLNNLNNWQPVANEINSERSRGSGVNYPIPSSSLIVYWGAMTTDHVAYTGYLSPARYMKFSNITDLPKFKSYNIPFPIALAANVPSNQNVPPQDALQFEFTPFQVGSITPGNVGYIPTKVFGTAYENRNPKSNLCWFGDTLSWLLGLSSSAFEETPSALFNLLVQECEKLSFGEFLACIAAAEAIKEFIKYECPDDRVCPGTTNNFLYGIQNLTTDRIKNDQNLQLVDGGYAGNLPIGPLLHRNMDMIVAIDSSFDQAQNAPVGRPSGESLIISAKYAQKYNFPFPIIPNTTDPVSKMDIFTSNLLNKIVVFDPCNTDSSTPTVIYIPLLANKFFENPWLNTYTSTIEGMTAQEFANLTKNTEFIYDTDSFGAIQGYFECLMKRKVGQPEQCSCPNVDNFACVQNGTTITTCRPFGEEEENNASYQSIPKFLMFIVLLFTWWQN